MNIGIIGAGNVGGALGRLWAERGHEVCFGLRDPRDSKAPDGARMRRADVPGAARFGEVVAFATPWQATLEAVKSAGDLSGKVVVDCTNPLLPNLAGLAVGLTTSGGEEVAKAATGARVVKCFNTVGAQNFSNPRFGDQAVSMFVCGDDESAKATVSQLGAELGFDMVDTGPLAQARLLEPLAMLWISMAYKYGRGPNMGFQLLRR
jgi:8-hydroxy-5-deazaflavin:NADPH oxidoreductase